MKKRKIVLFVLMFIILFFVATLYMPFSFVSKPKEKCLNYEYVFKDIFKDKDPFIKDIAMLGAHDAFSSGINLKSVPNSNESSIVTNKTVNALMKGLMVRMSKAQNATAKELLYSGVRYLDVRLTKIEDDYYTYHGLLSNKLEYYLQDVVDYLCDHKGEFIIFDIQYFMTKETGNYLLDKEDYEDLFNHMRTIKNKDNKSIFDYLYVNKEDNPISSLKYSDVTNNKNDAGVIILAKTFDFNYIYPRDKDASYEKFYYYTIRSLWHETNSIKELLDGINSEYNYLIDNPYEDVLVVNQAQRTAFLNNAKIINSLFKWSLLDMAKNTNRELIKNKDEFIRNLSVMPIFMVDYATSNAGNFNKLVNEYIIEYNKSL